MRRFLWFLVALGVFALGASIVFIANYAKPSDTIPLVPIALYAALWLVWGIVALLVLLFVTGLLRRMWIAVRPTFGDVSAARILALGIVSFLFAKTALSVLLPVVNLLVDLTITAPGKLQLSRLFATSQESTDAAVPLTLPDQVGTVLSAFTAAVPTGFSRAITGIAEIDWPHVFLAVGLWIVLGQILSDLLRPVAATGQSSSPWRPLLARVQAVKSATWINLSLFALIGSGCVLSVSVLIAIPVLSGAKTMTEQELEEQGKVFEGTVGLTDFEREYPDKLPQDPELERTWTFVQAQIARLRTQLGEMSPPPDAPAQAQRTVDVAPAAVAEGEGAQSDTAPALVPTQLPDSGRGSLQDRVATATRELNALQDSINYASKSVPQEWTQYQSALRAGLKSSPQKAVIALKSQSFAPGGLNEIYVGAVERWLGEIAANARSDAADCRMRLQRYLTETAQLASRQLSGLTGTAFVANPYLVSYGGSSYRDLCQLYRLPTEPVASQVTLGPFAFSTWLIQLNSVPLVLIAGMLGFGLLGAAGSSVIRNRESSVPGDPLVKDLPAVIVRGFSATIVVYLAVKGGLLMVTGGTSAQADPHILLLTCLVAAVFSENVWDAMKEWIASRMKKVGTEASPGTTAPSTNTTGPVAPAVVSSRAKASLQLDAAMPQ